MQTIDFGKRLKLLRLIKGMTQVELADKAGVSLQYLGRIERGISFPSFKIITSICSALEIEPAALFLFSSCNDQGLSEDDVGPLSIITPLDWSKYITGKGLWMTDILSNQHFWSLGLFKIMGYEPSSITPNLQALKSRLSSDHKEPFTKQLNNALKGKSSPGLEFYFSTKKGLRRLGIQHIDFLTSETGKVSQVFGIILDITESKALEKSLIANQQHLENYVLEKTCELSTAVTQIEAEYSRAEQAQKDLAQSLEYSKTILEMVNDGIIVHEGHTLKIIEANQRVCDMYGYTRDEVLKLDISHLSSGEDPYTKEILLDLLDYVRQNKTATIEWQARKKDGKKFWVEVNLRKGYIGAEERFFASIRDINKRKTAQNKQKELEEKAAITKQQRQLETITGSIAHEFSNLLQIIQHSLEGFSHIKDLPDQADKKINSARKAISRAANLTRKMLSYSGRGKFRPELVNLNHIIEDHKDKLALLCNSFCRLKFDMQNSLPLIMADHDLIVQAVKAMVGNSCEAINTPQSTIHIRTGHKYFSQLDLAKMNSTDHVSEGHYTYLEIEDSGEGMEESTLIRIFDPFFSTRTIGRGLGMSAVMTAIHRHNGAIDVKSIPGKGTMIRVLFPAWMEHSENQKIKEQKQNPQIDLNRLGAILIVDDEELIRDVCGELLQDAGFDVLFAADGIEAIDTYRQNSGKISCVILDLTMPRMNGIEAYQKLCEIDPRVKVIISSGYNPADKLPETEGKIMGYLQKPYSFKKLLQELHKVLEMGLDN
ncbi:PAS domain S-box protein [Desulfonatronovibrio magnus]|uniref:PAS domain S-box protein n=1 Tax=Desulfonatronovibrio magnus TaxID=698827 RepID=UPI0006962572|nr:PAS domain S-box protein [Desulfonatronovibrio magnus]